MVGLDLMVKEAKENTHDTFSVFFSYISFMSAILSHDGFSKSLSPGSIMRIRNSYVFPQCYER